MKLASEGYIVVLTERDAGDYDMYDDFTRWQAKDKENRYWMKRHLLREFGDKMHYKRVASFMNNIMKDFSGLEIISTQNPSVFDLLTYTSAEDARSRILLDRGKDFVFLTEQQAEDFWNAYEAGIQHVSEIFRTQGLW